MTTNLDAIHGLAPVVGSLPGEPVPYYLPTGEGQRYEIGNQLWTVIARSADSGGGFDAAFVLGPRGAGAGFHSLADHQRSFYVFDGAVQFWLPGESRVLGAGDSIHVPAGVPVAYRFTQNLSKFLLWSAPGGALDALLNSETEVAQHIYSAKSTDTIGLPGGWQTHDLPQVDASDTWDTSLPSGVEPYFIRAHEGEHREWPDAINTFSARGANTGSRYFSVLTLGAKQPYIPQHFHQQHTENFFCVSGRVWLSVNGTEVLVTPGDYVHAPAGTIHSYAFGAHNTRMLGVLTTDIFEPFFDRTGDATTDNVYTEGLVNPTTLMGKLGQIADLDVVMVGPPPQSNYAHLG
ncbi:quercetin 2,3-dioxygenase [Gordonia sp. CPCC 205515]|uniref:quercetin 2,3-dioxygenase n=1 Tax=Gordonia sp. CPCC 205515 TaxID=3140791 RepID=UPI003AF3EC8B